MEVFALLGEWRNMEVGCRGRRECGLLTKRDWSGIQLPVLLRKHAQTCSNAWWSI